MLGLPAAKLTAAIAAGLTAIVMLAGMVRVAPILLAPGVPPALAPALLRGALGVALETATFLAPSIGWALAASRFVDRGEARAVFALGVRPARIVSTSAPLLLIAAALSLAASIAWGREAEAPGRLVRDMTEDARRACARTNQRPSSVEVPMIGLSWICLREGPPRAVIAVRAAGRPLVMAASSITLSDDLRSIHANELGVAIPASGPDEAGVTIRAEHASIRGLVPLGRASNVSALARAAILASTSAILAALAALAAIAQGVRGRPSALAIGIVGPCASLLVFSTLEQSPSPPQGYAWVPLAGVLALGLCAAAIARVRAG